MYQTQIIISETGSGEYYAVYVGFNDIYPKGLYKSILGFKSYTVERTDIGFIVTFIYSYVFIGMNKKMFVHKFTHDLSPT